ncbi:MAG: hypothetical protein ACRYG8_03445 [Janthinobacterium lividum]
MADLSDIENALVSTVAKAVYPDGVPSGSAPQSPAVGAPVRVLRGWPDAAQLDADLAAGIVTVTVYSMPGHSRPTSRYLDEWRQTGPEASTLTVATTGTQVLFGGVGGPGQIAGVQLSDGTVHSILATGSASAVAAALAAVTPGATASGPTLTMPGDGFIARTGGPIAEEREVRRQQQGVRVILWCPNPALRDAAASVVDGAFAEFDGEFLTLSDGTGGLLKYQGVLPDDVPSKADLWKQTLEYSVEYPTMQRRQTPPVLFPRASVTLAA